MALDLTTAEETITALLADDDTLPFAVTDSSGVAVTVAGVAFTFRVLPNQYSLDADALITKGNIGPLTGITIDNAGGGLGHVTITPADKAELEVRTYWYDLHMVESNGTDTTLMRGPYVVAG